MGEEERHGLFETKEARFGGGVYKLFASTIFACIGLIWVYRVVNMPTWGGYDDDDDDEHGGMMMMNMMRWWAWATVFVCELVFGFYWIITQSARWRVVYQTPFPHKLSHRFVCSSSLVSCQHRRGCDYLVFVVVVVVSG